MQKWTTRTPSLEWILYSMNLNMTSKVKNQVFSVSKLQTMSKSTKFWISSQVNEKTLCWKLLSENAENFTKTYFMSEQDSFPPRNLNQMILSFRCLMNLCRNSRTDQRVKLWCYILEALSSLLILSETSTDLRTNYQKNKDWRSLQRYMTAFTNTLIRNWTTFAVSLNLHIFLCIL